MVLDDDDDPFLDGLLSSYQVPTEDVVRVPSCVFRAPTGDRNTPLEKILG